MPSMEWADMKRILRKAYMSESKDSIIQRDSPAYDDFWSFFAKYRSMNENKGRQLFTNDSVFKANVARQAIKFDLSKPNRYVLRELPKEVCQEFEFILSSYLTFRQKEFFSKLQKLRKAQAELPIRNYKSEILKCVAANSVVVIAGDTGCGKSTQVPQYLLEANYENIACTQPRRIACISLSNRVAFETLEQYGSKVAFQIRFERSRTLATRLLFLTEGLLLRQFSSDDELSQYDVIILDEVHERHLHGDFLIGLLKELLARRPGLRLILMSATINLDQFKAYYPDAPVIEVPGRLHPIRLIYSPPASKDTKYHTSKHEERKIDPAPYLQVLQQIDAKYSPKERGDVLAFLSGISEIQTVADTLKVHAEQSEG